MRRILFALGFTVILSACGDPLRDVARLGDVVVADGAASVAEAPGAARQSGGGLFDRLLNRAPDDPTNSAVASALAQTSVPAGQPVVLTVPQGQTRATGPDATDVPARSVLPFGRIARVCGLSRRQLGKRIEQSASFSLYDTIPNTTANRPFYITGFSDNCARTFTGAVVVTGDVQTHEFVRYRASNRNIDYTTADTAYEVLKARMCGVGEGQPCGSSTARLNRNTKFITVYDFFGGTFDAVPTRWAQILVHDGEVLAMSVKDGT